MIHYVIEAVDEGQPLLVKEVDMVSGESLGDLETRIHQTEWKAIVEGTRLALENLDKERHA
jgi:phosphoribosylglycinamide formyltransferase